MNPFWLYKIDYIDGIQVRNNHYVYRVILIIAYILVITMYCQFNTCYMSKHDVSSLYHVSVRVMKMLQCHELS